MKLLFFTDSRGEHKLSFANRKIFPEKFLDDSECDLFLCPFKWTTTLDFIRLIEEKKIDINKYDKIILYTGVVEFSPRNISNFKECMQDKFVFLKHFLGKYLDLNHTYGVHYKGEDTKSLITTEAYQDIVIPYLQNFDEKLILINTNNIVPQWDGNYLKVNPLGRPKNINVVSNYSKKTVGKFSKLVNLLEWDFNEVKKYTVDNMHLTYAGSEFIYKKVREYIN
jgi:hypothetical protein